MNRVIEVIISPKGEATIQTKGFAGKSCLEASKFLESALGIATAEHKTSEFYQQAQAQQHLQQK